MTAKGEQKRTEIIQMLADGNFHSGQQIGETLAISRVAVSKHVQVLTDLGLDIFRVNGKGYKLASPLSLLNTQSLQAHLRQPVEMEIHHVVGSTNDVLRHKINDIPSPYICLAEAQTAGRGRQGKKWTSPYGASIYLSMYNKFSGGYQSVNGLSLVVGLAVYETLSLIGIQNVSLKWPNDVYVANRKIAGILIELEGQVGAECHAIIGIGLNVEMAEEGVDIDQPWIDITKLLQRSPDRNELCALLINQLMACLARFEKDGFAPFAHHWSELDYLYGKPVVLTYGHNKVEGIGGGVDHQGALLIETSKGTQRFFGGNISVRQR